MENNYDKRFSLHFNKNYQLYGRHEIFKCSNKLIIELIKKAYNDPIFKEKIHDKIIYYTNFSTDYLTGEQFISQQIDHYIELINKSVIDYVKNHKKMFNEYMINLKFTDKTCVTIYKIEFHEMINGYRKHIKAINNNEININSIGKLLANSIIFADSLKYSDSELMAILIIYIYNLKLYKQVEELQVKCQKMVAKYFDDCYYDLFYTKNKNYKEKLNIWLELMEKIKFIPDDIIELCLKYMIPGIQQFIFKKYITDHSEYNYGLNYEFKIDDYNEKTIEYINDIYKAHTITEWIKLIKKLLNLTLTSIHLILNIIGKKMLTLLGIMGGNRPLIEELELEIISEKTIRYCNGINYTTSIINYGKNKKKINETIMIYNKNLELVDEKYIEIKEKNKT